MTVMNKLRDEAEEHGVTVYALLLHKLDACKWISKVLAYDLGFATPSSLWLTLQRNKICVDFPDGMWERLARTRRVETAKLLEALVLEHGSLDAVAAVYGSTRRNILSAGRTAGIYLGTFRYVRAEEKYYTPKKAITAFKLKYGTVTNRAHRRGICAAREVVSTLTAAGIEAKVVSLLGLPWDEAQRILSEVG